MAELTPEMNQTLLENLRNIAKEGFRNAARGFADMIGNELSVWNPDVRAIPITEIPEMLGGPENDAVAIYLRMTGEVSGQIVLVIPYDKALEMCDLVLEQPYGTTQNLGTLERSALAEVGNLAGTFFMNAMAEITGITARPSPPAVMVDMVGSILDVVVSTMGDVGSQVMLFQSTFMAGERHTQADFWVIPDTFTVEKLGQHVKGKHG
ncbi:MAG TPA: chemotaxis protein CheC [Anaerolineaceae bacterium]|nr:chemotaxis protein CheC [Anaerolineaceae bacterium]HPN52549.1 chemotaxis protein CheC [Anaerolineaceae bacterium]